MHPIDIQHACDEVIPVSDAELRHWIQLTLQECQKQAELTLRLVDAPEITYLNFTYRKKNQTTNVLAFPANLPKEIALEYPLLGDIIVCPLVIQQESIDQSKPLVAHWAHIVIHGTLHLLGYDHINEADANIMQSLETKLLVALDFNDPYKDDYV